MVQVVRKVGKAKKVKSKVNSTIRSVHVSSGGNSLSVTLNKKHCQELGITKDDYLRMSRRKQKIILERVN